MAQTDRLGELLALGDAARREARDEDARTAYADAIRHCRAQADLPGEALALTRQAQIARDTGNLDWALHDQQEAIRLYRLTGDPCALAHALRHAGDMFVEQRQLAHAVASIGEALDLYRAAPDVAPVDLANAARSAALLADALGEAEPARTHWADARARYAVLGIDAGVAEADARLAALAG